MTDDSSPDPLLGTVLEGRFRLERLLGEGGMGRIYIAEELRLRRRCAVKVLLPELVEDPTYVERFLREAQAIAALQHDNVVDIYSLGEDPSGLVFFAMELLVGEDLETRIDRRTTRPYGWEDCCRWGIAVTRGMAAVHHAGFVHRDLKPSNVFLARQRDGREVVKLLDFGIASRALGAGNLTSTGATLGTPDYMAPERVLAAPLDGRADVYSLGVLLFELLTGELPFHGEPFQVAMQQCNAAPPRPRDVAPAAGIPEALEAVVLRAMAKDPAQRFASMEAFEAALVGVVATVLPSPRVASSAAPRPSVAPASEPVGADERPHSGPELMTSRSASRRLSVALVAVTIGSLLALLWLMREEPIATSEAAKIAAGPVIPTPAPEPAQAQLPAVPVPVPTPAPAPAPAPAPITKQTPVTKTPTPRTPRETKAGDPRRELERKAQACRRKHDLVAGPALALDYSVRSDGSVSRASARKPGALATCLVAAIKSTRFEPRLALGQTIEL